jgi:hypothetical protein
MLMLQTVLDTHTVNAIARFTCTHVYASTIVRAPIASLGGFAASGAGAEHQPSRAKGLRPARPP